MTKFFPLVDDIVNKQAELDLLLLEAKFCEDIEKVREINQKYLEKKKELEEMQTKQTMNLIDQVHNPNY